MRRTRTSFVASALLAVAALPAQACGEGQFSMGNGMRYQGYLAPRPATILVYDADPSRRDAIYHGLHRAGHTLTVARTQGEAADSLRAKRFDVVIGDVGALPDIGAPAQARMLPILERKRRNEADLRARFPVFLLEGASLGQYLKGIDRLVRME